MIKYRTYCIYKCNGYKHSIDAIKMSHFEFNMTNFRFSKFLCTYSICT